MTYLETNEKLILGTVAVVILYGVVWTPIATLALVTGDPVLGYYPGTVDKWLLACIYFGMLNWAAGTDPIPR